MTQLLKKAFTKASSLPEREQNTIATIILEELDSEFRWENAFANFQAELAKLADEALAEHRVGRTQLLDPDRL